MTEFERLLQECNGSMTVEERKMINKGLYCDGYAWIRQDLTDNEKICILAEELGHHVLNTGDILDLSDPDNAKEENKARRFAYQKLLPPEKLIHLVKDGYRETYEIADQIGLDEGFVKDCLGYYAQLAGI